MKRLVLSLLLCAALTCLCVSALCDGEYRTLTVGSYGNDVLNAKNRLKELGYFSGSNFNNRYTDDTAKRVASYEASLGLPQTGVLTPALQARLFDEDAGENSDSLYRDIAAGTDGDDVLRLKKRLKELGYFNAKAETGAYNDTLAAAIKDCQTVMGLEANGIADVAFQEALFAGRAASAAAPSPAPIATPNGPTANISLPALNEAGFLADSDAAPFIHADRADGHWYYITQNVYIEIVRLQLTKQKITWFETEIRCTPDSLPQAFLAGTKTPGHYYLSPVKIAKQYNAVFAISDDFYGYRWYNRSKGLKQGVIVRNGEIRADESQPAASKKWPYLEILAMFGDGSMRVFESDEHTAQEYIDMGALDTFAFGPILIQDGVINPDLYDKSNQRYLDDDPRMAMGCVEPCHYIILTVKGRTKDSSGASMHWIAERMKTLGCENALNLDGGGTCALYFMGDVLNKVENSQNLRDVSSMFGFAAEQAQ